MLKNDKWIIERSREGMIVPHCEALVRTVTKILTEEASTELGISTQSYQAISYGLSSYGYDLRLSPEDFRIFRKVPGEIADPKDFSPLHLSSSELVHDREKGDYFILPAHSYGLGVAIERLKMPDNITGICTGKSTYARMGVIANLTAFEAGWEGHPTLEFSNSSGADCRLYANEGVVQLLFLEGEPCETTYRDRSGKYQGQGPEVTLAKL